MYFCQGVNMEKIQKKSKITVFKDDTARKKLNLLFHKAQTHFRNVHNNMYKPDFTQEEYTAWNDYIKEDWKFRPNLSQAEKNRQFNVYQFPFLEASSRNPDKKFYHRTHLAHDLAHFFRYLPLTEIRRMTYVMIWLLKEALKNYGVLIIPGFGTFALFDKPVRETHQAFCAFKWAAPRYRLSRTIEFYPSNLLVNIVTPRDTKHMGFEGKYERSQYIPEMFGSFVDEKIHRYRGRIFIQDVFDRQWNWLGYSDEYAKEQFNLYLGDTYACPVDMGDLER